MLISITHLFIIVLAILLAEDYYEKFDLKSVTLLRRHIWYTHIKCPSKIIEITMNIFFLLKTH